MKRMRDVVLGITIGVILTTGVTAGAAAVKNYVMTEVTYPVFVNGKEYKDTTKPILNYEGSTYVPLAKLGDITGLNYMWNDSAKRVEINTSTDVKIVTPVDGNIRDVDAELAEREWIKRFTENNPVVTADGTSYFYDGAFGMNFFNAYNAFDNTNKGFTDEDDIQYILARLQGKSELPPRLSDGWISGGVLRAGYGFNVKIEDDQILFVAPRPMYNPEVIAKFPVAEAWESGEKTVKGVRIVKHEDYYYFSIDDLAKSKIIK